MDRNEILEAAREFYSRRSSSYSPRMDGGDRYELMANFAADIQKQTRREDSERLDWLEKQHTLHKAVEILYVVDGYELSLTYDGMPTLTIKGDTVRDAIDIAQAALKPSGPSSVEGE